MSGSANGRDANKHRHPSYDHSDRYRPPEVIDIESSIVVVVAVQRQQGRGGSAVRGDYTNRSGDQHTEIVERIAFMHQFIH